MSRSVKAHGQLRIIGGQWRGRKLRFPEVEGLRPTTDRVRETLFNWLTPEVHGVRCLDLFSGSGALGLEALSRGAASCDFVDSSPRVMQQIDAHLQALCATGRGHCHQTTASSFLRDNPGPWDIVFIDPPFGKGLVTPCCNTLQLSGALSPGAMVYIETSLDEPSAVVPANWQAHREKQAGSVRYQLFSVHAG